MYKCKATAFSAIKITVVVYVYCVIFGILIYYRKDNFQMKNKIKVVIILGIMVGIAALAFWIVNNEDLKIKGKFFVYETQQYLAFQNADEVSFSFVIIDGTSRDKKNEEILNGIMLLDKNGNQYAVDEVEKNELEKNRVYSVYSLNIKKADLPKGETVFQKVIMDGKELELGNVVIDIVEVKEKNVRDNLELGWFPFSSESDYLFSIKSDSNDISVTKILYDLKGNKKYKEVELNQSLKKGKEEELSFEVDAFVEGHCSMRPIIELKKGENIYHILPTCETTSFHGLTKEEILEYIERMK